jgi:hypothetical protein
MMDCPLLPVTLKNWLLSGIWLELLKGSKDVHAESLGDYPRHSIPFLLVDSIRNGVICPTAPIIESLFSLRGKASEEDMHGESIYNGVTVNLTTYHIRRREPGYGLLVKVT